MTYGLSVSGWMEMKLFKGWLIKHFFLNVSAGQPILLLIDGTQRSSRYNLEAVEKMKLFCLCLFHILLTRCSHLTLQ